MSKQPQYHSGFCVIYIRCSTSEQDKHGFSPETQKAACEKYAEEKKLQIRGVFQDIGISGRSTRKRTQLVKALEMLRNGDELLVYAIARASRSMKDMTQILDEVANKNAYLRSATENLEDDQHGKLLAGMKIVLAEFESTQISHRVKDGMMTAKKRYGTCNLKAPYGYHYTREGADKVSTKVKLVRDEYEQNVIKIIFDMRGPPVLTEKDKQGIKRVSFDKIAEFLNEKGYHTRNKSSETGQYKKWHGSTVNKIYKADDKRLWCESNLSEDFTPIPKIILKECIYFVIYSFTFEIHVAGSAQEIHDSIDDKSLYVYIFSVDQQDDIYKKICDWLVRSKYAENHKPNVALGFKLTKEDLAKQIELLSGASPIITTVGEIPGKFNVKRT